MWVSGERLNFHFGVNLSFTTNYSHLLTLISCCSFYLITTHVKTKCTWMLHWLGLAFIWLPLRDVYGTLCYYLKLWCASLLSIICRVFYFASHSVPSLQAPEEPCVCRTLGNDLADLEERKTRRSTLRDHIESETPQWSYQSRRERPAECTRMFCDVQIPGITCSRKQRLHVWKSSLSADQVLGFS